ncbi:MAG: type II toxin-antitoxin system VapC family toxin [Gemmataceae bacterium]|nr:type II toxin-antitoxin system VapC family toxin [Gemmataceae bacterium]
MARFAAEAPRTIGLSPISVEEALRGRLAVLARPLVGAPHIRAYAWLVNALELFQQFHSVPFDQSCDTVYQQLRAQQLRVGTQDLKIAAVALANTLTLVTRNRRDFARVPGLFLDDWSV